MKNKWKILYLGLDPSRFSHQGTLVHYPLITIVPREFDTLSFAGNEKWSHVLFTSRSTIPIFFDCCKQKKITLNVSFLTVGKATAAKLREYGDFSIHTAHVEQQEGVIALLQQLKPSYLFFPHAAQVRPLLLNYLKEHKVPHIAEVVYETRTHIQTPLPQLDEFDEIVFTSPSIVEAFIKLYHKLPRNKKLTPIGMVTQNSLDKFLQLN